GVLSRDPAGGQPDPVVGARQPVVPGNGEIEMVRGAPGQRFIAEVRQHEFACERERAEAVANLELVLERVRLARGVVRFENRIETGLRDLGQPEYAIAG